MAAGLILKTICMIQDIINRIKTELVSTFNDVFAWFGIDRNTWNHVAMY